jgi:hypothetical protein
MENKKPSVFVSTYDEGIRRVLDGNYAFLMESTTLDYFVHRNCNLTQIGGLLDSKYYGIATPIGNILRITVPYGIIFIFPGSFQDLRGEIGFPWPFSNFKRRASSTNCTANGGRIKKRSATNSLKAKKPRLLWASTALVYLKIFAYIIPVVFPLSEYRQFSIVCRWRFCCPAVRISRSCPYRHHRILLEFEEECGLRTSEFQIK